MSPSAEVTEYRDYMIIRPMGWSQAFSERILHIWKTDVNGKNFTERIFYIKKILMSSLPCLNQDMFWWCCFSCCLFFSLWFFFLFVFLSFSYILLRFPLKSLILFLRTKLNPTKYMKFLSSWIADYMATTICPIFPFLTDARSTEMEEGSCI